MLPIEAKMTEKTTKKSDIHEECAPYPSSSELEKFRQEKVNLILIDSMFVYLFYLGNAYLNFFFY